MDTCYLAIRLSGLDQVATKMYACCGVSKLWSCGYYYIVHLPSSVLCFCWSTQLYVICFPFNVTRRTLARVRRLLSKVLSAVSRIGRNTKQEVLRKFVECELDETKGVLDCIHELQRSSLVAATRVSDVRRRILTCKSVLTELRNKTRSRDGSTSSSDQQISRVHHVLCSVEEILRSYHEDDPKYWKKRDPVSNGIEPLKSLISIRSNPDDDGLCQEYFCNDIDSRDNSHARFEHIGHHQLGRIHDDQPKDMGYLHDQPEDIGHHQLRFINHDHSDRYVSLDENENEMNLLNLSIMVSDKIIGLLKDENKNLKESLTGTKGELDSARHELHSLNEKVSNLECVLDVVRERLSRTEAERDVMRDKLSQLDSMIEEQEVFLVDDNDDTFDDYYSELSLNPRRISFQ